MYNVTVRADVEVSARLCVMDTNVTDKIVLRRARLLDALKTGFSAAWDRMGLTVAVSLVCGVIGLPAVFGLHALPRSLPLLILAWLIGTPLTVGAFVVAHRIVYREDPSLRDIADGFRKLLWRGYGLSMINLLAVTVLASDSLFLLHMAKKASVPLVPKLFAIICFYLLWAWLASAMYQLPILVAQAPLGQRQGALRAVKKSWLLGIGNPVFTIGLFIVILGFGILSALSVIGMLILYAGVVSVVLTSALRELYIKYGVIEEQSDGGEDGGWRVR